LITLFCLVAKLLLGNPLREAPASLTREAGASRGAFPSGSLGTREEE